MFPAGQRIGAQDLLVESAGGEFTDCPFDCYETELYFSASVDGRRVPAELESDDSDPLFTVRATAGGSRLESGFDVELLRTRGSS